MAKETYVKNIRQIGSKPIYYTCITYFFTNIWNVSHDKFKRVPECMCTSKQLQQWWNVTSCIYSICWELFLFTFLPRVRWKDDGFSCLCCKYEATASSRLVSLSTKTGNSETAILALSNGNKICLPRTILRLGVGCQSNSRDSKKLLDPHYSM